jgi:AmiR/NasT family two-component response regulator
VVMARKHLDSDAAYRHLISLSHRARLPLRQLAEQIVTSDSGSANVVR